MRKEYDLIRELGRGNWIDEVAGEAVLLGYSCVDPDLQAKGAELSQMVREIKFDSDQFYRVIVAAKELQELVRRQKERNSAYLDRIVDYEMDDGPKNEWQYELSCISTIYQIRITLPAFYTDRELDEKDKMESAVMSCFDDPTFSKYRKERKVGRKSMFTHEATWSEKYFDDKHRLIREIDVHEHQDDSSRGFREVFYFDGLTSAATAWTSLREAFTSSRHSGIT